MLKKMKEKKKRKTQGKNIRNNVIRKKEKRKNKIK